MKKCRNPLCLEPDMSMIRSGKRMPFGLCPSCRYIGKWGMFCGGVLVGLVVGALKLFKLL